MDPITLGAIIGAGTGLASSHKKRMQQKDQAAANAVLASISPWNSVFAQMMRDPGAGGGGLLEAAQGGLSGAAQGGKFKQLGAESNLMDILKSQLSPQAVSSPNADPTAESIYSLLSRRR